MFLFNKKMMGTDPGTSGSEASKGTYAYDKLTFDRIKTAPGDSEISFAVASSVPTENALTYLVSDHFVETDDPDAEKQIITNHDYILEVTPAKDAAVKTGKESFDANAREVVVAKINDTESAAVSDNSDIS